MKFVAYPIGLPNHQYLVAVTMPKRRAETLVDERVGRAAGDDVGALIYR